MEKSSLSIYRDLHGLINKLLLFNTVITHIYDNHIKFEVSLHFWRIWPTLRLNPLYEIAQVTLHVQNKDCLKVRISNVSGIYRVLPFNLNYGQS